MADTIFLFICVALLKVHTVVMASCSICADIQHFSEQVEVDFALGSTYKIFNNLGLLGCVQQCMFRARCQSVNFDRSLRICELNQESTNESTSYRKGIIFSEVKKWTQRLALQCENHECPNSDLCVINSDKTTKCVTDGISPLDIEYKKARNVSFFYRRVAEKANYSNAQKVCEQDGGHLVEIQSAEKNAAVQAIAEEIREFKHAVTGTQLSFLRRLSRTDIKISRREETHYYTATLVRLLFFDKQQEKFKSIFIGAQSVPGGNSWRWVTTGSVMTYSNWEHDYPKLSDSSGSSDKSDVIYCVVFKRNLGGKWIDHECYSTKRSMCEITFSEY